MCKELSGSAKRSQEARMFQRLSGVVWSSQYILGLPGVVRSCQELTYQVCQGLLGVVRSFQDVPGVVRNARGCQELECVSNGYGSLTGIL